MVESPRASARTQRENGVYWRVKAEDYVNNQSQSPASLALAEQILARYVGGRLRLELQTGPEDGSQRSTVLRCQVLDEPSAAPASVILKQVNLDPGQIFRIDSLDRPAQAFSPSTVAAPPSHQSPARPLRSAADPPAR